MHPHDDPRMLSLSPCFNWLFADCVQVECMSHAAGIWSSRQAYDIGKVAAGVYWKVDATCFKQECRSDGYSLFLFLHEEHWWITSHPIMPYLRNPWLIRGVVQPGNCHADLSKVEWRCPFWEESACPSIFVYNIHTMHENSIRELNQESVTLRLQHLATLKSKDEELARLSAELEAVKAEILTPTSKPRGYMHANPSQTKSGWFNKMVALLGAVQTGDHTRFEELTKMRLSYILYLVLSSFWLP